MTDMGRKATPEISTLDNLNLLLRLIQLYILEDNMDILSELLICIKFLHYDLSKENIKFILDEAVAVLKNIKNKMVLCWDQELVYRKEILENEYLD